MINHDTQRHIDEQRREKRARRRAQRQGYALRKFRPGSRGYAEYGPYLLVVAATNGVASSGLDLDGVERCLNENEG